MVKIRQRLSFIYAARIRYIFTTNNNRNLIGKILLRIPCI